MDTDHMTYEQLLQLCNSMGYENSSVKASNIDRCFRNTKPSEFQSLADKICCICQDRFQRRAGVGKLNCGHNFHINSVKPWILTKKQCPVCQKTADDDEHQTQSYQVETIVLSDDDEEDMNSRDHQQYDPEQLLLFYEIPTGRTHRPFSLTSMRKWWDQGLKLLSLEDLLLIVIVFSSLFFKYFINYLSGDELSSVTNLDPRGSELYPEQPNF
ncbi:unnamed protein product [Arabidopsis thaliana]|uniref:RING-type E3 ubiquitin transferase n=1 Tax=Arabidopsis thaliana TaxID=3702 RepID=A0A7G2DYB3_ARATH|nr:unnamed protein product [Arabidopsis thaliana]